MNQVFDPAEDWGPFGRPLFQDPSVRKLSRVGIVDVGSNSVRLVIFDGAARSPAYFYNEKIMCALGAGLSETGRLNAKGRARALAALERFQAVAAQVCEEPLTAVATAAVREAEDGPEFCAEVEAKTGLKIHVIDGQEEARLSAQGVLLGWPGSYGLVCDIGGSSMELAEIRDGNVGRCVTSQLGPLKLKDINGGAKQRAKFIRQTVKELHGTMGEQRDRLFLVGGSWRAIARFDMDRQGYPLHLLHEYRMTAKDVRKTVKYIAEQNAEDLRQRCDISLQRMSLVPLASEVLQEVVDCFDPHDVAISSYGIREGLLYEQMPEALRQRDPLIEACRFAEAKDARLPGFGRNLFEFVLPLFPNVDNERRRLIKAACLLHDVSWRAHPDFRPDTCFDYVARSNLGGLTHIERIFLGLALLHRYKNKRTKSRFVDLFNLLPDHAQRDAEILGKAMRFGAMLWMETGCDLGKFSYDQNAANISLKLPNSAKALYGEVAQARLMALSESMDAEASVTFLDL